MSRVQKFFFWWLVLLGLIAAGLAVSAGFVLVFETLAPVTGPVGAFIAALSGLVALVALLIALED